MKWPIAWQAARQGAIIIRDPAVVCVDLRQMRSVQQQRRPQKGLMMRGWVDTGFKNDGGRTQRGVRTVGEDGWK